MIAALGCGPTPAPARPTAAADPATAAAVADGTAVGFELPDDGATAYATDGSGAGKLGGAVGRVRAQVAATRGAALRPDRRLDEAAAMLVEVEAAGVEVTTQLVREVLWWRGVPEASPVIGLFSGAAGGDLEERIREHLERRSADGGGPYGLAEREIAGGTRVVVLSLRGGIELAPVPRRVAVGTEVSLHGAIEPPHDRVTLAVTDPAGRTTTSKGAMKEHRFSGAFAPDAPGVWQVELLGDGPKGPWVLANFPLAVDVPLPRTIALQRFALEADDERKIERLLFDALNESRAAHDLAPVSRSRKLDRVARAYSEEMQRTGNVGHVSPISGGPGDRAAAAGLSFPRLRENLARAGSAAEAHQGLMRSPAHRANILDPQAFEAGVGVALSGARGEQEILVTELIVSRPEPVDPRAVAARIIEIVDARRSRAGVRAIRRDGWLDRAAERLLGGCFDEAAGADIDMQGSPFKRVAAVQITAAGLDGVLEGENPALVNPAYGYVGVAAKQGSHPQLGEGMICIRVVFGAK